MIWLLLVLQILPRTELSPGVLATVTTAAGVTRPLTTEEICERRWGTDSRHVYAAKKRLVFERFGIAQDQRKNYEVDHLIPRELGGADDLLNLWPQPWLGPTGAHVKDHEENRLHRAVCAGTVALEDAQDQMRRWPE